MILGRSISQFLNLWYIAEKGSGEMFKSFNNRMLTVKQFIPEWRSVNKLTWKENNSMESQP